MSLISYEKSSPFRPANWRWELASDDADRSFRRCDDPAVQSAKRFSRCWQSCRSDADRRVLASRMPLLFESYSIYRDPTASRANALEARVLAGERRRTLASRAASPLKLCRFTRLSSSTFAVASRARILSFNQVIGPLRTAGAWTYDIIWKFFAYIGGSHILDEFMNTSRISARPTTPREMCTLLSEEARAALRRRMLVDTYSAAGDHRITAGLAMAHDILSKQENASVPSNSLVQAVDAMIKEIKWLTGDDAEKNTPPLLAEYDRGAAELRTNEACLAAQGKETPEMAALKDLQLPKPKERVSNILSVVAEAEDPGKHPVRSASTVVLFEQSCT